MPFEPEVRSESATGDQSVKLVDDSKRKSHTYREVVKLSAASPPHGLGLQTNIRALSIYYRKYLVPSPVDRLFKLALTNPAAAQSAAVAMLQAQAYYAASSPHFNIHTFNAVTRFLFRKRNADLDQRAAALRQSNLASRPPDEASKEHAA